MTSDAKAYNAIDSIGLSPPATGFASALAGLPLRALRQFAKQTAALRRDRALRHLTPHLLRDIGLTEGDIAQLQADVSAHRPSHLLR